MPGHSRIEINPRIILGKPVVRGTRITVEVICENWARRKPSRIFWTLIRICARMPFTAGIGCDADKLRIC